MNIEIIPPLVKERLLTANKNLQKAIDSGLSKEHSQDEDFSLEKKMHKLNDFLNTNRQHISYINQHLGDIPYFNQAQIEEQIICIQKLIAWAERVEVDSWYLRKELDRWEEKRERLWNYVHVTSNLYSSMDVSFLQAEMSIEDLEEIINIH